MAPIVLALAMVIGTGLIPASVSAAPVGQTSMQGNQYYVVRPGDTLSGIALQYGTSMYAIMQANGISDPNHIMRASVSPFRRVRVAWAVVPWAVTWVAIWVRSSAKPTTR